MPTLYNNNAFSTLAAAITSSGQTSVTVQTGHGDRFPIIVSPDVAFITLENTAGTREVIKITARAAASDVLTVTRGEEGTSATTWAIGDLIEQRITAGELTDFRTRPGFTTTATSAGTLTLTKGSTEIQTLTGTTTHTVVLPVVSTLYTGKSFTINNNSTGIVTVNSSGSNAVVAIQPENSADIICVLITGTTASSWTVMTMFGASNGALPGTLAVGGTSTMAAINASGAITAATCAIGQGTFSSSLSVTGPATFTAGGTSTMAAINASGTVAMAGAATVGTTLGVTGNTTIGAGSGSPQLKLSGAASSTANSGAQLAFAAAGTPYAYISNGAWIKGGGSTDNNLSIWTDAGLGINLFVNNNATTAALGISSAGAVTIPGTLGVTGLTTLTGGASYGSNTTWASDNTFNIGAVGANRPANIYVGTTGQFGGFVRSTATSNTVGTPTFYLSTSMIREGADASFNVDTFDGAAYQNRLKIVGATGAVTIPGSLGVAGAVLLGTYGVTNGILNTGNSMRFNIDSTNTLTGQSFSWGTNTAAASGGTVLMTLLEAGNLGVNVSPSAWVGCTALEVGYVGTAFIGLTGTINALTNNVYYDGAFKFASTGYGSDYEQNGGGHYWKTSSASGTAGNTATMNTLMTLTSAGSLLLSPTSTLGTINLDLYNVVGNEADHIYAMFRLANGTSIGSIRQVSTTSAVVYNTTSDYRIKDLFGSFTTAREMLSALTVHDGQFKGSEHRIPVLVAHEVQAVTPWAVMGEKDAVDDEGAPVYQQMGTGAHEALLIAGWQDHEARLAALQADFQSYKNSHP